MSSLEQIKKISIYKVAIRLGLELNNGKICCVFHNERTPSLSFFSSKAGEDANMFKCFGCGEAGSNIDLVMRVKNLTVGEAARWIDSGTTDTKVIKPRGISFKKIKEDTKIKYRKEGILDDLIEQCGEPSNKLIEYMESRGITKETIKKFKITDIKSPNALAYYLIRKWSSEVVDAVGLFNKYKKFLFNQHRILFPYLYKDSTYWIQGRVYNKEDSTIPYLNIKIPIEYPYNCEVMNNNNTVYITEGVVDCISLDQMGYPCIAIPGVGVFKDEWIEKFNGFKVYIAFDNDKAGFLSTRKLRKRFMFKGILPEIKHPPEEFKDWNKYLTRGKLICSS